MGACMSMRLGSRWSQEHGSGSEGNSTAKVISLNGSLREYAAPVGVGEVLGAEKERAAAAAAAAALLMCNSDSLYFDETVPAMDSQDELRPNQMYFVLSASKKEKPLSAADMASLAVKATKAMIFTQSQSQSQSKSSNKKKKNSGRRRQRRSSIISPLNIINDEEEYYHHPHEYHHELTVGVNITRKRDNKSSRSTTTRAAKKKLMMPIPSFTLRLSTIYESSSS